MADEIIIETTSAEVIEVGVPGPQGPAGAAGAGLTTLTTAGDLLYRNNTEATRLPVGSNGQVLKVAGGLPAWANESGAVTSVNGQTGAVTVAAATHATEHEAGEADEIQAMAALVTTADASLNGIYVPNASGTTSGGRLTLYKTGTRENTKLEYNQSLGVWHLIKNTVIQLVGQEVNATYAWTPQQWLDERSPQSLPNGGTVTRAGLEVLARRAADGTSNVATATTSQDGLLSSADKTKLNGIAANATANTASSATPSALGTAASGSSSDYARADHTHSAEVSDSAFRVTGSTDATKKVAIEVDTNVPTGTTVTLTAPSSGGTIARTSDIPAAFDPASPGTIGGTTPAAATFTNLTATTRLNLPNTNGTTAGDLYRNADTLRYRDSTNTERTLLSGAGNLANLTDVATARSNLGLGSAATSASTDFAAASHTHAASAITSGVFDNARINFAAPSAIGSTTASSVAATTLSASSTVSGTGFSNYLASPPAIGGTSAAAGSFTTLSASTSLTLGTSGILSGGTNTIEQRNTTSAQTFRIYNTVSGAADANYERAKIAWSSNVLQIGTEKGGTGSARALELQTDGVTRLTVAAAGTVSTSGNFSCVDLTCGTLTVSSGSVTAAATGALRWNGRARLNSPADSIITVVNAANTDFDRLQFGGTTSSFPALKRSSTSLQVRLADDTAYSVLDAQLRAQGTAPATSGATGTAGDIRYDADYIYVCTAANTWKRAAIVTW